MRSPLGILLIAACLTISCLPRASAEPYGFRTGNYDIFFESSYFSTKKNFDASGSLVGLPPNNQLTEYRFNLNARYDLLDWLGIFGNLGFRYEDTITYPLERTNSGLSDFSFGGDALVWGKFINIVPTVFFSIPLYPVPGSDNAVPLGSGADLIDGRVYLTKNFNYFSIGGYGGYQYQDQGHSSLIPWGVLGKGYYKRLFLEAVYAAEISLNNDIYAGNPSSRTYINDRLMGGSFIYNSVNASQSSLSARLGWYLADDLYLTAGVEQSLSGIRAAQGMRILVGIGLTDIIPNSYFRIEKNIRVIHRASPGSFERAGSLEDDSKDFKVDTQEEDKILNPK